jgi:hypothetical protein
VKEQEPVFDANFVEYSDVNGSKANALFSDALETDEKLKELKIIVKMH